MKAKLLIKTVHKDIDTGQEEKIVVKKEADVVKTSSFYTIRYKDDENISKIIKISKDEIETFSFGNKKNRMVFKNNLKFECNYKTDYGFFKLDIKTKSLEVKINNDLDFCAKIMYNLSDNVNFNQLITLSIIAGQS